MSVIKKLIVIAEKQKEKIEKKIKKYKEKINILELEKEKISGERWNLIQLLNKRGKHEKV